MTIQSLSRNKKNALSAIDEYLRRGSEARSSGAFSAAFACYVQALKLDSRKYQGWVGLALCCGDMGRPALSEKAALRAIEIEPSIPHAWQILAEFRLKAGDAAGVLALAGKAAELNPGSHIPDYIKAKILRSENNGRGAEKCCRLALAKEPGFMPAWHELLGLAASSGAFGRMVGVAGEAIRNCAKTDCPGLISALGSALFADPPSGPRLDAAAKIYGELGGTLRERGLRLPENFSREMAVCQVRGGRLREAEAGLAGFLGTMRPDSGSSVESFRAKFCLGRYREAFEEGEKLLKRKEISLVDLRSPWFSNRIAPPSFWKKHISLLSGTEVPAGLLIWKSFYLSALRSLVLRTGADFSGISKGFSGRYGWMNFYPACETLGRCDFPGALAKFRRVAACLPRDPMVCCKYGEALLCAGKRAAGFREFDAAISLKYWQNESTAWKGQMCLMTGDYGRAVEILGSVKATFSRGWLGAAYYKTGRLEEAAALLEEEVNKKDPLDQEVKLWLGELYRVTGRFPEARKLLDELLEKEPAYHFALVNRALLFMALGRRGPMRRDFALLNKTLVRAAAAGLGLKPGRGLSEEDEGKILGRILELACGNRRMERYFLNMHFPGCVAPAAEAGSLAS